MGVYAGDLNTTTPATIGCKTSILCSSATPSTENDRKYANEAKEAAERAEAAAEIATTFGVDPEWNYVITDVDTFVNNISTYKGNILVKGITIPGDNYTLSNGATYLKFIKTNIDMSYSCWFTGNKNCTLDGLYSPAGPDSLGVSNFGKVVNCKHDKDGDIAGYPLELVDCDYISNCNFGVARNCNHISDCTLTIDASSIVLQNCTHIHGLKLDMQYDDEEQWRECIFDKCSYMSNINVDDGTIMTLDIIYRDCLYVDADTCSGFLSDEDVGKVKVLTDDGSFETTDFTGIESVKQTTTSSADGGTNIVTVTLSDGTQSTFQVKNGSKGSTGAPGGKGADGQNGTSVTVSSVSETGADGGSNVVTFSDGKTLTVKNGSKGSTGEKGDKGDKGDKGETGATGATGAAGSNGTSVTHSWTGTTLTVTSASGTSSANLKGAEGDKGDPGDPYTLTTDDKNAIATLVKNSLASESWTFELEDGTSVTKAVYVK